MLYLITIIAIALVMYIRGISPTDPDGLIAMGVLIAMAVTYRNQQRRKREG